MNKEFWDSYEDAKIKFFIDLAHLESFKK